ncbi:MAG TPA: DUF4908 domain-containing protein [Hyphomonadaceae bacterium]|nr:DUF4908 domain-containing protein [Hyphomonadaceae bacterium]
MKEIRVLAGMAAALAGSLIGAGSASAQAAERSAAPSANRYEDASSDRSFLFQQKGKEAIVKFEDTNEVMVLQAVPAQRGDTFLRNDNGQVLFKLTEQGNLVSYVDSKMGAPVALLGPIGAPLSVPPLTKSLNALRASTAGRLTKLAGHDVTVFGVAEASNNESWTTDLLNDVVTGVEKGRGTVNLIEVRLVRAAQPSTTFKDGSLVLGVNPAGGEGGRPSAESIAIVLKAAN